FLSKLRVRMERLRIGDPLDKTTDIGAIVSAGQMARSTWLLAGAKAAGSTTGQSSYALPATGQSLAPGCTAGAVAAGAGAAVARVAIFGPGAATTTFRTVDEAVELANNTSYGLAASIWSENTNAATELAARVKAGVVWINATNIFDANAPFGGYKESGYGRE